MIWQSTRGRVMGPAPSGVPFAVHAHGRRLARFGLVGGAGVVVNSAILYLLVSRAGWHHLPAAAVSTEAAILGNFVLNDRWTFLAMGGRRAWPLRLWRYNAVALGGVAVSLGVLAVLTMGFGLYYLLANLAGIGLATLWNYVGAVRVVFDQGAHHRVEQRLREEC